MNCTTLRGSGGEGDGSRHLVAALDHAHLVLLGQADVGAKTNESSMFQVLLDRIDIASAAITADALCQSRYHASYAADPVVRPIRYFDADYLPG